MSKVMKKPGSFNFSKEQPKEGGCRACKKNKSGFCAMAKRELPIKICVGNIAPNWCPKSDKNGGYSWKN